MARDDLDDEERALIEKHRAERKQRTDDDFEVEVGDGAGNYARLPYSKARNWLKRVSNFDIDDEPEQEEPEPEADDKGKRKPAGRQQQGGNVRAFRGRGVG